MNILAVDIGNTRTKWKFFAGSVSSGVFAAALPSADELKTFTEEVDAVICGSVRDQQFNHVFSRNCQSHLRRTPKFLTVQCSFGALKNGYESPSTIGVDRWLAMIAGWDCIGGELLVVDFGTAVTVDAVDAQGQHKGGYIVPGLRTLIESLNKGAGLIDVNGYDETATLGLGANTQAAVSDGCVQMLVSFIRDESQKRPGASLLLTGGGAKSLLRHLPERARYLPDLVLDGIFLAAASEQ